MMKLKERAAWIVQQWRKKDFNSPQQKYGSLRNSIEELVSEVNQQVIGINDLLLKLEKVTKGLKSHGTLIIIPAVIPDTLTLRVSWYYKQKHSYQGTITVEMMENANVDVFERFVCKANDEITRIRRY